MKELENEFIEEDIKVKEEQENIENQSEVQAYDYYDRYYESVLANLDTIKNNQESIIANQDNIISQNDDNILYCFSLLFIISLFFIYYVLRNMIKK